MSDRGLGVRDGAVVAERLAELHRQEPVRGERRVLACQPRRVREDLTRRAFLIALGVLLVGPAGLNAQSGVEIFSKADAARAFAMTKQQWRENVAAVAKAGVGKVAGDAVTMRTSDGSVTTLPIYEQGGSRPSRVEITVVMSPSPSFTDDVLTDIVRDVRRQMAPEYAVEGRAARLKDGATRFFFKVSESQRRP